MVHIAKKSAFKQIENIFVTRLTFPPILVQVLKILNANHLGVLLLALLGVTNIEAS